MYLCDVLLDVLMLVSCLRCVCDLVCFLIDLRVFMDWFIVGMCFLCVVVLRL